MMTMASASSTLMALLLLLPTAARSAETTEHKAVFAGGCFWHMYDAYRDLPGVEDVRMGYAGGWLKNPKPEDVASGKSGHAEVVEVTFNPKVVSYVGLLNHFWEHHNPESRGFQGSDVGMQFRSQIFTTTTKQKEVATRETNKLKTKNKKVTTVVTPLKEFYPVENPKYHCKENKTSVVQNDFTTLNLRFPRESEVKIIGGKHEGKTGTVREVRSHALALSIGNLKEWVKMEDIEQVTPTPKQVTTGKRTDRFGAQLHCIYAGMAYAKTHGFEFCLLGENYKSHVASQLAWVGLDIKGEYACPADSEPAEIPVCGHSTTKHHPGVYYSKGFLREIRRLYENVNDHPSDLGFSEEHTNVAVHIRRGHHISNNLFNQRNIPLEQYLALMNQLRKQYTGKKRKPLLFHIYSEKKHAIGGGVASQQSGKEQDFSVLEGKDVKFHLDEELRTSFHGMATADILVVGGSELSITAALLNPNIIYYPRILNQPSKLYHPPLPHYIEWGEA